MVVDGNGDEMEMSLTLDSEALSSTSDGWNASRTPCGLILFGWRVVVDLIQSTTSMT
jgi:hypothetical protein